MGANGVETQQSTNVIYEQYGADYHNAAKKFREKVKKVIAERGLRAAQLEYELFLNTRTNAKNHLSDDATIFCYQDVIDQHIKKLKEKQSKRLNGR